MTGFKQLWRSCAVFMVMWVMYAAWERYGMPLFSDSLSRFILDVFVVKALIWTVPVAIIFLITKSKSYVAPDCLFKEPFPVFPFLVICCGVTAVLYTLRLLIGLQNAAILFDPYSVWLSIAAGVIEELSFRGYFFNRQYTAIGLWPAATVNGVLFVLYHYPGLLFGGSWVPLLSLRSLFVFSAGIGFCLIFHRWRSLALNMAVHFYWDFLSFLFYLV